MQVLIRDLLIYSRIMTRGRAFVRVDLNAVVSEALSHLKEALAHPDTVVDVGTLPSIDADPFQMRQLIDNLIGNALKFRRDGEPLRVAVRGEVVTWEDAVLGGSASHHAPAFCRLVVEDDGIGFDEQYAERIFGVFQRLHGRHQYGGSGIGLAICRRVVERHLGRIEASGEAGKGATFTVYLPTVHEEEGVDDEH